jgi:glutaminyl-peptide cyclotransferase
VAETAATASAPPIYTYRVVNVFPHDPTAFTQGLVYQDGIFYEGTGQRGQSTLRKVNPITSQVLQGIRLPDPYWGEGIAVLGDRLYQLTWQENTGFVYDKDSFDLLGTWRYEGEGWGLTTDGQRLIMSDGTNELRFLDPETLDELGRLAVVDGDGQPVARLNELEWVEGEVWANVWLTDLIARIDPATGQVLGWIDLTGLLPDEDRAAQRVDVLNGIAYDAATGRLFVTGKWWPKLFQIELTRETP